MSSRSLETRVERLEQHEAAMAAASESTLLVTFQGAREPDPLNALHDGRGQAWERAEAETDEAFLQRAVGEAAKPALGCVKVLFAGQVSPTAVAA